MTETLFGGLIAVVVLFLAARKAGLSSYWSGVLSGTLPFLAYLGYSTRVWMGSDVIAIHFVVFLAAAGVLGVCGSVRLRQEKMHWVPKLIIVFFCLLAVFLAALTSISMHGLPQSAARWLLPHVGQHALHTGIPGILAHDENHLYEKQLKRSEMQRRLGWVVRLEGQDKLRKAIPGDIKVTITDAGGKPVKANSATLNLLRMADSEDDRKVILDPVAPGVFRARVTLSGTGQWIANVNVVRGEDEYFRQTLFIVPAP